MQSHRLSLLALALALPLSACPAEDSGLTPETTTTESATTDAPPTPTTTDDPETGNATTDTPPPPSETTSGPETTTGAESTDETGPTNPPTFDLGTIPEAPPLDDECGEVDFMFVIDNSGSMGDEQTDLVANFPTFIEGIQNILKSVDSYHVGVITTDEYGPNIPECQGLSGLVVQTGGLDSSNMVCGPYDQGDNFMTEHDDLAASFSCAAQVGTVGDAFERPMQAVVEAVSGVKAGPGQCNDGFIRESALLVIVIITDEADTGSSGDAMSWYEAVLDAKDGIEENVVVLSLINTPGGGCGFDDAVEMSAFTDMWGINGFSAPICAADWSEIFEEAIGVIDIACENYIPPG